MIISMSVLHRMSVVRLRVAVPAESMVTACSSHCCFERTAAHCGTAGIQSPLPPKLTCSCASSKRRIFRRKASYRTRSGSSAAEARSWAAEAVAVAVAVQHSHARQV